MTLIAGGHGTGTKGTHVTTEFDAWPLIPETVSKEIQDGIVESSAALSLFSRLPNMSSRVHRMPLLSTLGYAEFVCDTTDDSLVAGADVEVGDAEYLAMKGEPYGTADPGIVPNEGAPELKPTHQMKWENIFIVAEPIAIILPVPDDVLDDSEYDLWAAMRPRIIEAFHQRIDNAIVWGQNRPQSWPSGVVPTAIARGQVVAEGTNVDFADDLSALMGILEAQAYDPSGFMAAPSVKATLRGLRDTNGMPIFAPPTAGTPGTIWGLPLAYVKNNTFQLNTSRLIAGKMDEAKYAIRSDMSWKLFTEGVISDENGKVILNLMQQDSKAMRVVMRLGWAVPNSLHALRPNREGYPFAVLTV
jgi:HK97 family phage major capsid protein